MIVSDPATELQILTTLTGFDRRRSKRISKELRELSPGMFSQATRPIFQLFQQRHSQREPLLTLDVLLRDPTLPSHTRKCLEQHGTVLGYTTDQDYSGAVRRIASLAKLRLATDRLAAHQALIDKLASSSNPVWSPAVEEKYQQIDRTYQDELSRYDAILDLDECNADTVDKHINEDMERLNPDTTNNQRVILTGWPEYDKMTGGIPTTGYVMLLSANSGGCKSYVALHLATEFHQQHLRTAYVSLEMDKTALKDRELTKYANMDMRDFARGIHDPNVRAAAAAARADAYRRSHGCLDLVTVARGARRQADLDDMFNTLTKPYDVVIIDFVSLIRGRRMSGEQEYQMLRNILYEVKGWADRLGALIIVLAQTNKDGELAYAKGMIEAAHYSLSWTRQPGDTMINMIVGKRRVDLTDGKLNDFWLDANVARCTFTNIQPPENVVKAKEQAKSGRASEHQDPHWGGM